MHADVVTSFIPPLTGYAAIAPAVLLLVALFWGLFADFLPGKNRGAALVGTICASLAAAASALIEPGTALFGGRLLYTLDARFAATAICILAALWCLWTFGSGVGRTREAISLAMFSTIGAVFAVSAHDLIVLILVLELTAMPAYVLIGYRRYRIRGLEAALKYFLLSVMTSLIMIYGMSFLVGLAGGTTFAALSPMPATPLTFVAFGLVLFGLLAKLSAAPFHWWAPDAYEGAEPWAVAFASTIPKLAVTIVMIRLTFTAAPALPLLPLLLMVMAILSLIVGAFAALPQKDARRMLAYSGVVNGGFILMGMAVIALGGPNAPEAFYATALYIVAYAIASMGALLILAHEGGTIANLTGLAQRRPLHAWALAGFTLSLIGIPPLIGFFVKLNLFMVIIAAGQVEMVVLGVLMTVIGAFYYLRLVRTAFFNEKDKTAEQPAEAPTPESSKKAENSPVDEALTTTTEPVPEPDFKLSPYSITATTVIAILLTALLAMGVLFQPIMTALTGGTLN